MVRIYNLQNKHKMIQNQIESFTHHICQKKESISRYIILKLKEIKDKGVLPNPERIYPHLYYDNKNNNERFLIKELKSG